MKSTLLNGVVYLGSVLLYEYFICAVFKNPTDKSTIWLSLVAYLIGFVHTLWLLLIYIISLVLSTFWVQDVFDRMLTLKKQRT